MADIKIYGTLTNMTGGPVAKATEVKDEVLNKTQAQINQTVNQLESTVVLEDVSTAADMWNPSPEPTPTKALIAEVFTSNDGSDEHPISGNNYETLYVKFYTEIIGSEEGDIYTYPQSGSTDFVVDCALDQIDGLELNISVDTDFTNTINKNPGAQYPVISANQYISVSTGTGQSTTFMGHTMFYDDGSEE